MNDDVFLEALATSLGVGLLLLGALALIHNLL